jgi:RNA polymerase sigma-70 factor, ECF subfamily
MALSYKSNRHRSSESTGPSVAMARTPGEGLALLDQIESREGLGNFHLLHAARADLLRRLGHMSEAAEAYQRALALATNDVERRFLRRRSAEVTIWAAPNSSG